MSALVHYASARLRSRRRRVLLAAAGIAAASAMVGAAVTAAWSLSTGFDRAASRANLPDATASFDTLPRDVVAARAEALPYVRDIAYRLTISGRHVSFGGGESDHATLVGVPPGPRGYAIIDGRVAAGPREAVVEAGLARAWHVRPGDSIEIEGRTFAVSGVGVSPDTVAFPLAKGPRLWLPYEDVRELDAAASGAVNQALIWVDARQRLDVTLSQARMASYGVTGLQFVTRAGVRALIGQAGGIVIALLVGFSVVSVGAAGAMLGAAAAGDVQRRLASIGLLRAMGASTRAVTLGFALESALVAIPSAAIGLSVGWLIASRPTTRLLESLNQLPPGRDLLGLLALALLAIVALVALASALPAWRAATRSPVETLRGADVVGVPRRAPVPPGAAGLGVRLALARPLRSAATVAVLGASAAVVLLILAIATFLAHLQATPAAVGKRYELSVAAPASAIESIRALPGVAAATPRWSVDAADSFELGEAFTLVAFRGDHTRWESPPLAEGRRVAADDEAEVGLGLAHALDLHPGATLAAQLAAGGEVRFRVVGVDRVLQNEGRLAYVRPRRLLAATSWVDQSAAVKLEAGADGSAVEAALEERGLFSASAGGVSGEAVQDWAGRNGGFVSILVALLRAIATLDGLVCVYVLVQMLALTARERRQAVAVVRACGAGARQVAAVFAGSAVLVAGLAAPVGIVLERHLVGPAVSRLAASYVTLPLAAGAGPIAVVVAGLVAAAFAAAWCVARSASRQAVVIGLREE